MKDTLLLDPVRILHGPGKSVKYGAALIIQGKLIDFDNNARMKADRLRIKTNQAKNQLLAPCLVDPHSVLEKPISATSENISTLRNCAAAAGYGLVALLPRSSDTWRDRPERLCGFKNEKNNQSDLLLWGGFSLSGKGEVLSPHADLIQSGVVGLAEDDYIPPIHLLERGLLLGEMGTSPILIAPRDPSIQRDGMVREGVETLRAGWNPDPISSELLPLSQLLSLKQRHPQRQLRLMNISTSSAVEMLDSFGESFQASVCWWHLLEDRNSILPTDLGLRVCPSLGGRKDRDSLRSALLKGIISAVAVHAIPLDAEDINLPADQRPTGLSGHHLVLPTLWNALVETSLFSIEQLWQALSFGPSAMINQSAEKLQIGSRRWILFDPKTTWTVKPDDPAAPRSANVPWLGREIKGRVTAYGLRD